MAAAHSRPSLLGQGALARFIADGHLTTHIRRTRLLYAARREALIAGIERHLARWLETVPDRAGTYLAARAVATSSLDDLAVVVAAAEAGLTVAPLSACFAGRRRQHGLILGYAGTPEDQIDAGCVTGRRPPETARSQRQVRPGQLPALDNCFVSAAGD